MGTIRLPGLIDVHVHMRDPGATHKEDWDSGTASALAGGYTCVLAMPNTSPPITDAVSLEAALAMARKKARCDYGIYMGAVVDNPFTAADLAPRVAGLKIYLDQTFGPLHLRTLKPLQAHMAAWPRGSPLLCHAEGPMAAAAIMVAMLQQRPVHICHVSSQAEVALIRAARERGIAVTCEVTPHHLFLTADDASSLGAGRCEVRPRLNSAADQAALWQALSDGVIDCITTDHAPHTLSEKDGDQPPPGFPGLETSLALLLGAVRAGRLTLERLVELMHTKPARLFGIAAQPETWVEVDPDVRWEVRGERFHSRCGWTPFEGRQLEGMVRQVTLRGVPAFEDAEVLSAPGSGLDVTRMQR